MKGLLTFEFDTVTLDAKGEVKERPKRKARYYVQDLGGGVTLEMVEIPGGAFLMGSSEADVQEAFTEAKRYSTKADADIIEWFNDEKPQHRVTVSGFYMGKYEVTQAQYRAVMAANPSWFKGDDLPATCISWDAAGEFCQRLSQMTEREYRLPSEVEWEYACRGGTQTPFAFGLSLSSAWAQVDGESPYGEAPKEDRRDQPMPCGTFSPNGYGLYDMHGSVFEWCLDHWHRNYDGAPSDGSAWLSGGDALARVVRGGFCRSPAWATRSAHRGAPVAPASDGSQFGFRLVAVAKEFCPDNREDIKSQDEPEEAARKKCLECGSFYDLNRPACPKCGARESITSTSYEGILELLKSRKSQEEARDSVDEGARLLQQGDLQGARDAFEKALKINPNNPVAHSNLGALLCKMGSPGEGIPHLEKALDLDPRIEG